MFPWENAWDFSNCDVGNTLTLLIRNITMASSVKWFNRGFKVTRIGLEHDLSRRVRMHDIYRGKRWEVPETGYVVNHRMEHNYFLFLCYPCIPIFQCFLKPCVFQASTTLKSQNLMTSITTFTYVIWAPVLS